MLTAGFVPSFSVDTTPKTVESVFVFQERSDGEPSGVAPTYDAIVVEQWTIIDVSGDTTAAVLCLEEKTRRVVSSAAAMEAG